MTPATKRKVRKGRRQTVKAWAVVTRRGTFRMESLDERLCRRVARTTHGLRVVPCEISYQVKP